MKLQTDKKISKRAAALILTLSLIFLITVMVVSFFARTRLHHDIETSAAWRDLADTIALGALDSITADLQNEIRAASVNNTIPFRPANESAVPVSRVVQNLVPATLTQLVKQSVANQTFVPTAAPYNVTSVNRIIPAASNVSTTTPSIEGRIVSATRWNSIRLLSQPLTIPAQQPNWIYISRAGIIPVQNMTSSWTNPSSNNPDFVIGRIAYNIYDTSGLLNVNVAGYPTNFTTDEVDTIKGSMASADLSVLPGMTQSAISTLIAFRNPQVTNYVSYIQRSTLQGFNSNIISIPPSSTLVNSFFVNRQDLLRFALRQNPAMISSLPFFIHSKPSINSPSARPRYDANQKVGGSSNVEFQYRTNEALPSALNRDLLTVKFPQSGTVTGYKVNGSSYTYQVREGEPLIKRRFPLHKLAWLGPNGPVGVTAQAVQHSFGLRWNPNTSYWQYVGPTGNAPIRRIATLDEVAMQMREPNFFELLQAVILDGSLGISYGEISHGNTAWQNNTTLHILRIGACIIDQYDSDSFPTIIEFDSPGGPPFWRAIGVEDLPYIELVNTIVGDKPNELALLPYVNVRLFNPHRSLGQPTNAPAIRLSFQGVIRVRCWWGDRSPGTNIFISANGMSAPPAAPRRVGEMVIRANSPVSTPIFRQDTVSDAFRQARFPQRADFVSDPPDTLTQTVQLNPLWSRLPSAVHSSRVGLRLPDFKIDPNIDNGGFPSMDSVYRAFHVYYGWRSGAGPVDYGNFMLEYQTPDGRWLPYAYWIGINDELTWASTNNYHVAIVGSGTNTSNISYTGKQFSPTSIQDALTLIRSDPRSFRINPIAVYASVQGLHLDPDPPLWSRIAPNNTAGSGYGARDNPLSTPAVPGPNGIRGPLRPTYSSNTREAYYYPAWLSRNFRADMPNRISAYEDADGVRRIGDSGRFGNDKPGNLAPLVGNPYVRNEDRPVVLNRPFRNVGELGYVFRDLPWKTLDFFSANSADSALLDIFTLTDSDIDTVEDRLNLQRAPAPVLQALLNNSRWDASPASGTVTTAVSSALATSLISFANMMPSTCDLILSVLGPLRGDYTNPAATDLIPNGNFGSNDNALIKARREMISRTIGSLSDARTWHLTVDLIAQSGRILPSANSPERFNVNGEQRYWLHLAIDRYSGKVISRSWEAVNE